MIITRTPFRISFFGGGSDYPVYYKEHGGAVLNATINKYCYINCRFLPQFFDHKFRIRYTQTELTQSVDEITHPSVKACLKFMGIERGVEVIHTGDIPALSGIGSSSSFTVGLLNALYALKGQMVTKRKLAFDAIYVEQQMIGENVGSQDQTAAAFGGLNKIDFGPGDDIFVQPIVVQENKLKYLQECMMFFFTGFSRHASNIASAQIKATPQKIKEISEMRLMVDEAISILNKNESSLDDFGELMNESWKLKKSLTNVITNKEIDDMYDLALRAGAVGGKLCGAGGGGFLLLFVPPENQARVREALKNLMLVPFRFEALGSHIIFYAS